MDAVRRFFRQAAALALVAISGLALAPTVSHALAAQVASAQPWSELCSVGGDGEPGMRLAHCPLCAQPGHSPALPAAPQSTGLNLAATDDAPAAAPAGVLRVAFTRVVPPSRAPPQPTPA